MNKSVNVEKGKQGFQPTEKAEAAAKPLVSLPHLPQNVTVEVWPQPDGGAKVAYVEPLGDGREFCVDTVWTITERVDKTGRAFIVHKDKFFTVRDADGDAETREVSRHEYDRGYLAESRARYFVEFVSSNYAHVKLGEAADDTYEKRRRVFDEPEQNDNPSGFNMSVYNRIIVPMAQAIRYPED